MKGKNKPQKFGILRSEEQKVVQRYTENKSEENLKPVRRITKYYNDMQND